METQDNESGHILIPSQDCGWTVEGNFKSMKYVQRVWILINNNIMVDNNNGG